MAYTPPGTEYDPVAYKAEEIRADLTNLVSSFSYQHAARIVKAIMADYTFTPRKEYRRG